MSLIIVMMMSVLCFCLGGGLLSGNCRLSSRKFRGLGHGASTTDIDVGGTVSGARRRIDSDSSDGLDRVGHGDGGVGSTVSANKV